MRRAPDPGPATPGRPLLDWAVASEPMPGEDAMGDLHLVRELEGGALLAVVDGLGHGREATLAAQAAVAELALRPLAPLERLVERCHEALRSTRGAVMTVAAIDARAGQLSWLGVGDVEGVLVRAEDARAREWIIARGGVVGFQLPPLRAAALELHAGDLLLLATDGVREGFADRLDPRQGPRQLAEGILARFRKGTDDALVLVARYLGS